MATKTQFADAILAEFKARYSNAWAADPARLDAAMQKVWQTLDGGNAIIREGPSYFAALAACGLPKNTTLKALHALPRA